MTSQFKKVPRIEVDRILSHGVFQKCQLSLNFVHLQKVLKIKLATLPAEATQRIYVMPLEVEELRDKLCAFSFKIGTQMYFFKSKLKFNAKGFYVDAKTSVFELARRKHIRFETHKNYPIDCAIVVSADGKAKVTSELLNISPAGASFRLGEDDSIVRKGQTVHALIRAQGRAAFSVKGIVRFVKKKNNKPTEVGLEFSSLDEIQKNRIMTICEDLSFYIFAR
jgi:hypothetical protein